MTKKIIRRYLLSVEKLKTIEDIKKILDCLQIKIDTDNPLYDELQDYFPIEVVPKGYIPLLKEIGYEEIAKMTYEEMEQKIIELGLLNGEETKND